MLITFRDMQAEAGRISKKSGFWEEWDKLKAAGFGWAADIIKIALGTSEASEQLECVRDNPDPHHFWYREKDGKPEGYKFELADKVIRAMDEAEYHGIDLQSAIIEKMAFNDTRPHKHGRGF